MTEPRDPFRVLFLCTGNSARSMLAEMALVRWGGARFESLSAGSQPKGAPHPMTLVTLERLNYAPETIAALRSKSWDELARPGERPLDFVFTVCDNARGESCPVWPGQPVSAHWGVEDPAAFEGSAEDQLACFRRIYFELEERVRAFAELPLATLERTALEERVAKIGVTGR